MISSENFQLKKTRSPGKVFSDSLLFYRQNFKNLMVPVVIVLLPVLAAMIPVTFNLTRQLTLLRVNQASNPASFFEVMAGVYLIAYLSYIVSLSIVLAYIKCWQQEETSLPATRTVLIEFARIVYKVFLFSIPVVILIIIAFCFLLIPGIWISLVLTFIFPIAVFEDLGFRASYSKAFKLVKNSWWQSFSALFIAIIAVGIVSAALNFIMAFLTGAGSMNQLIKSTQTLTIPKTILSSILSLLLQPILLIVITLQYFNLSEGKDGGSLESLVDGLGNTASENSPQYASAKEDESF